MALPELDLSITPGVRELADWGDVDRLLEDLGRLDLKMAAIEADMGGRLYDLVKEYSARLTAMRECRAGLEWLAAPLFPSRKSEFAVRRSKQLTFGRIAFRVAESIEIPVGTDAAVIATLRRLGWDDCIEVKEKIDKNALKKLPDNDLARCGARRKTEDRFRIEPNLDLVAERIGAVRERPAVVIDLEKLAGAIKATQSRPSASPVGMATASPPQKEKKCRSRK